MSKLQKGSISIFVSVMILAIALVISAGIANLMSGQVKASNQIGHSTVAYYAAESGIERCIFDFRRMGANNCSYTNIPLDFNSGVSYTVTFAGGAPPIYSKGTFIDVSRDIEITW